VLKRRQKKKIIIIIMEKLDHKHKCISQLPLVHNFSHSARKTSAKTKYDKMEIQGMQKENETVANCGKSQSPGAMHSENGWKTNKVIS